MPRPYALPRRHMCTLLALTTVASWMVALWQAMPRLLAGPLCSSAQDTSVLAGHCPACALAVLSTLALLATLAVPPRFAPRAATIGSAARTG